MTKRGRPKRHYIDRLKTKVWFELCANGRTPYWFNINVDNYDYVQNCQKTGQKIDRNLIKGHKSKWEKYKHGTRTVDPKLVDILAEMFPGSDDLFYSHIWEVLKGEKVPVPHVIKEIQESTDAVLKYILKDCYWSNAKTSVHSDNIEGIIKRITRLSNPQALRAVILCLSWANEIENHVFWNSLCDCYHSLLPQVILDTNIPHRFEFLEALDDYALFRQFSSDTSRNDLRRSWRDQLAASKEYLTAHYSNALRLHDSFFGWPKSFFNDEDRRLCAVQMVEIIWPNEVHRYQSFDYWGPLGQLYAFIIKGNLEDDPRWKNNGRALAISILDDWNKERKKEEKELKRKHFKVRQNQALQRLPIDRSSQIELMTLQHFR